MYEARGGSGVGDVGRRRRRTKSSGDEQQQKGDDGASLDGDLEPLDGDLEPENEVGERTSLLGGKGSKEETASILERFGDDGDDADIRDLPDGIKLGLGDFIFYSVLVGRSAMQSLFCAVFCYVAVISGLIITLAGLAVHKAALPALPVSIALGVITFVSIKFLVEPFLVYEFGANAMEDFGGSSSSSSSSSTYPLLGHASSLR